MTQTPVTHHLPARRHAYHPHPYDSCRRTCTASRPRLTAVTRAPFITVLVRRPSLARGCGFSWTQLGRLGCLCGFPEGPAVHAHPGAGEVEPAADLVVGGAGQPR